MKHNPVKDPCVICNEPKQAGIYLYTSFICTDCEQKMIHTDPGDPAYKEFVDKLKKANQLKAYS